MSVRFASGKYALAICDRCGLEYKYSEIKSQYIKDKQTNLRVCIYCLDRQNPQLWVPDVIRTIGPDAQALEHPRPDVLPATTPDDMKWVDRLTIGSAAPSTPTYKNYYGNNRVLNGLGNT